MDIFKVVLTKSAKQDLLKVPSYIARTLLAWVDEVEHAVLIAARRIPGYHDEPLKGKRLGQRPIRLSRAYRAIYIVGWEGKIEIARVLEVNKHDY